MTNVGLRLPGWVLSPLWRGRPAPVGTALLWGSAVLVAGAVLLPVVYLIARALGASPGAWQSLLSPRTLALLGRTLGLAAAVTLTSALVAVPLAWLTVRTDLPMRRVWAVLATLPLVIPSYVGAYLIASAFGPRGLLQQFLGSALGIDRLPDIYGFPGAWLTLTLLSYPYIFLPVRAALSRMNPALEDASRGLGHGPWATFRRVTLPLLRPSLGAGALLVALYCLRDFGAVSIMRFDTLTRAIYASYRSFDRSQAALWSLILVLLTFVVVVAESRAHRRGRHLQVGVESGRPPPRLRLGAWRWPALTLCAAVAGASLLLPAMILGTWLVRGLAAGETLPGLEVAAWNSVYASGLAAGAAVVAGLPIAWLAVRRPGWATRVLERTSYSAFALPGIAISLGIVFFAINHAASLYQTLAVLILAYVILYLPQTVGAARASLLQIHPGLEEAARGLGRGPMDTFRSITMPLLRPGLAAGAALVFLTVMKDLPATLLLAPTGFKTLAVGVWSAVSEAYFAQAAAPALALILMSSVPMMLFVLRGQENLDGIVDPASRNRSGRLRGNRG